MKNTARSKRALTATSMLTMLSLLAACGGDGASSTDNATGASGEGEELTFVNYGGDGMTAAKAGWLEPYSEKTGVEFQTDEPSDQAKIKAMVTSGNVTWDVIDIDSASAGPECGKLYEERPDDFDTSELSPEMITDDCMIPVIGQTVGLVYNAELYGDNPPTSIEDFTDTESFAGQRITFNYWAGTAEPMMLAAGASGEEVYPIDWAGLNGMVDDLGSDLTFQSTVDQQVQAMESGNFGMCLCYLGRAALAAENGANIEVVWDKVWTGWDGLYVVKGTENSEAAWDFVQYLATSEGQNGYYEHLPYSPTTTGEPPEVPEEFKSFMPVFNEDEIEEVSNFDAEYWSELGAEAADEWAALTSG